MLNYPKHYEIPLQQFNHDYKKQLITHSTYKDHLSKRCDMLTLFLVAFLSNSTLSHNDLNYTKPNVNYSEESPFSKHDCAQ